MFRNPEKLSENACAVVFESEPDITEEYGSEVKPVDGFGDALQHTGAMLSNMCVSTGVLEATRFSNTCVATPVATHV